MNLQKAPCRALSILVCLLMLAVAAYPQRSNAGVKGTPARMTAEGSYEEAYTGTAADGTAVNSTLRIKFDLSRWVKIGKGKNGKAEFFDLADAPVPAASGTASFEGTVKAKSSNGIVDIVRSFSGPLTTEVAKLGLPVYSNTGDGLRVEILLSPKMAGACSSKVTTGGHAVRSDDCSIEVTSGATKINYEEIKGEKTRGQNYRAMFEKVIVIEPEFDTSVVGTGNSTAERTARAQLKLEATIQQLSGPGSDIWRGAVTNGSKEAGYKIMIAGNKQMSGADGKGQIKKRLEVTVTIVPGQQ
jgi:hypothetical protein